MRKSPLLVLAGFFALPMSAQATLSPGDTFSGTLAAGDPTFNRPLVPAVGTFTVFSNVSSSALAYDAYPFVADTGGTWTFDVTGPVANVPDTALYLYGGSFNPAQPLTNILAGCDDKSGPPTPNSFSRIDSYPLTAGNSYVLVVASTSPTPSIGFGSYTVTATPEPASVALLGMASLMLLLRRQGAR